MKRKEDHVLPITGGMLDLLRQAMELSGGSEWLFPGRWDKSAPVSEGAVSKAWIRVRGAWGFDDVTVHDLRRSFSTIAGNCELTDFEIDLVTDHKAGRSEQGSRYNQARYIEKKRQVLVAVERRLFDIVESRDPGGNVVPLWGAAG